MEKIMDAEDFLQMLCSYCHTTEVWYALWRGGVPRGFEEFYRYVGGSRSWFSQILRRLLADALIIKVGMKYQAISPDWLRAEF